MTMVVDLVAEQRIPEPDSLACLSAGSLCPGDRVPQQEYAKGTNNLHLFVPR